LFHTSLFFESFPLISAQMEGYTKLATLMGAYPEVAIVRRFASLNMQNVLYLQAELVHLESRLREIEEEDKKSGDENKKDRDFDWFQLSSLVDGPVTGGNAAGNGRPGTAGPKQATKRWAIVLEIREKLKEYSKCRTSNDRGSGMQY
jgi:hypothetical protein